MIAKLPYGQNFVEVNLPLNAQWISPPEHQCPGDPVEVIAKALTEPLSGRFGDFGNQTSVSIAINDKTRPVPHHLLLPPLVKHLQSHGIAKDHITFFIATGTHLPVQITEFTSFLPQEITEEYKVVSHDVYDVVNFVHLGSTSRGTPVVINKSYYEADLRIVVGDIELHHFAGFSGGVKSAVIGLGSRESIQCNHRMLVDENAAIGVYDANPLRQDIEEAGRIIGIHFALNAVLNENKQVVSAYLGKPEDVMRAGISAAVKLSAVKQEKRYDLVIASAGGYPKDINFYQAQKAISHASLFTKPGGTIILAAECREGSGSVGYEDFMKGVTSVAQIYQEFGKLGFVVGPHKALQVARQLEQHKILLFSNINPEKVCQWLITPIADMDISIEEEIKRFAHIPSVAVLPYATGVFPVQS